MFNGKSDNCLCDSHWIWEIRCNEIDNISCSFGVPEASSPNTLVVVAFAFSTIEVPCMCNSSIKWKVHPVDSVLEDHFPRKHLCCRREDVLTHLRLKSLWIVLVPNQQSVVCQNLGHQQMYTFGSCLPKPQVFGKVILN